MPKRQTGKLRLAPTQVLLDALERLLANPEDADLAYLLAVLLVRRRVLTDVSMDTQTDEPTEMNLTHPAENREFLIPIHPPVTERAESLQRKLIELLYCDS